MSFSLFCDLDRVLKKVIENLMPYFLKTTLRGTSNATLTFSIISKKNKPPNLFKFSANINQLCLRVVFIFH